MLRQREIMKMSEKVQPQPSAVTAGVFLKIGCKSKPT